MDVTKSAPVRSHARSTARDEKEEPSFAQDILLTEMTGQVLALNFLYASLAREPAESYLIRLAHDQPFSDAPFGAQCIPMQEALNLLSTWAAGFEATHQVVLEFRTLFDGPEKPLVAPWESAFVTSEGLLFQQQTVDVLSQYRARGFEINTSVNEPADHIAYELAFCALLTEHARQALLSRNLNECRSALEAQRRFFDEHVGAWGFDWANALFNKSESPYYQGIARFLQGTLQETDGALERWLIVAGEES